MITIIIIIIIVLACQDMPSTPFADREALSLPKLTQGW